MKSSVLSSDSDALLGRCQSLIGIAAWAALLLAAVEAYAALRHHGSWVATGLAVLLAAAMLAATRWIGLGRRRHAEELRERAHARRRSEQAQAEHEARWADTQHELRSMAVLIQNAADVGSETSAFGDAAASMLRKLDDFAAEAPCPQSTAFELRPLIARVASLTAPSAHAAGLRFEWRVDPATPAVIWGDEDWLRQVLLGLLSNALKYTEQGSIELACETAAADSHVALLRISVADTGRGIPAEDRARVFERGFRRRTDLPGAGLGLAIARTLIDRMQGRITLDSRPGAGSRFTVELPVAIAVGAAMEKIEPTPEALPGVNALLVEDDEVNRNACESVLRRLGCDVQSVESGESALRALADARFDVVLLDIQMPRMDGYETARRLRQQELRGGEGQTPIVAFTAHATRLDRERCLSAGMDGFVVKPARSALLAQELSRVLSTARLEPSASETSPYDSELVVCFQKHAPRETALLSQAITQRRLAEVHRLAHLLRGQSANFGDAGCQCALTRLEDVANQRPVCWPTLTQLAADATLAVGQLLSAMEDRTPRLPPRRRSSRWPAG